MGGKKRWRIPVPGGFFASLPASRRAGPRLAVASGAAVAGQRHQIDTAVGRTDMHDHFASGAGA